MHWVEVDGYPMPRCVGGDPALDFCNTWAGWGEPPSPGREYLRDYDRLAVWAEHAGLITEETRDRLRRRARRASGHGEDVLADARELRTAIHDVALRQGGRSAFSAVVERVERARAATVLVSTDSPLAKWELREPGGLELPVLAVASAAADLLTSPRSTTIRACPGDDCGWLFLDTRGRRRWCIMSSCGNRAKVRAHAERHRASR